MKLKKFLPLLLTSFLVSGCTNSTDKIYIGGILPMSGDYYYCGQEIKNGVELAISKRPKILDKDIKFEILDDNSDHIRNIDAYNKFAANKKICSIIGGGNSILSEDIAANSQKNPLPIIVPSASLNSITEYGNNIYRVGFTDEIQGTCMAKFALTDLNLKTAAVLYDSENNYSVELAKSFSDTFNQNGGKILIQQKHATLDNDFRIELNKIKPFNPDVLFVPDYAYNAVLIAKQARDIGIQSIILGSDTWEEAITQTSNLNILEGIYFCTHYSVDNPNTEIQNFVSDYKKNYKTIPSSFAALGFDSANILLDAIIDAKSTQMDEILNSLAKTNYSGITGQINFDSNHNPIKAITIVKISGGKNNFFKVFNS